MSEPEQFVRPSSIEIHVHPMCAGGVSELSVLTRLAGFPAETDHSGAQVCSHAKIRASTSAVASLQRVGIPLNLLPDDQAVWWPRKVDLCGL